jgi:hypothetical protein
VCVCVCVCVYMTVVVSTYFPLQVTHSFGPPRACFFSSLSTAGFTRVPAPPDAVNTRLPPPTAAYHMT